MCLTGDGSRIEVVVGIEVTSAGAIVLVGVLLLVGVNVLVDVGVLLGVFVGVGAMHCAPYTSCVSRRIPAALVALLSLKVAVQLAKAASVLMKSAPPLPCPLVALLLPEPPLPPVAVFEVKVLSVIVSVPARTKMAPPRPPPPPPPPPLPELVVP